MFFIARNMGDTAYGNGTAIKIFRDFFLENFFNAIEVHRR